MVDFDVCHPFFELCCTLLGYVCFLILSDLSRVRVIIFLDEQVVGLGVVCNVLQCIAVLDNISYNL